MGWIWQGNELQHCSAVVGWLVCVSSLWGKKRKECFGVKSVAFFFLGFCYTLFHEYIPISFVWYFEMQILLLLGINETFHLITPNPFKQALSASSIAKLLYASAFSCFSFFFFFAFWNVSEHDSWCNLSLYMLPQWTWKQH